MGNLRRVIKRKRDLTETDYARIEELARYGNWQWKDIAASLHISEQYLLNLRKTNSAIDDAVQRGKTDCKQKLLKPLVEQAYEGDREMAKWLLTRLFGEEFSSTKRPTVDNRSVNLIQMPSAMTEAQYQKLIEKMTHE